MKMNHLLSTSCNKFENFKTLLAKTSFNKAGSSKQTNKSRNLEQSYKEAKTEFRSIHIKEPQGKVIQIVLQEFYQKRTKREEIPQLMLRA